MRRLNDVFFNLPHSANHTSQGQVDLPIFYFDVSNTIAFFLADKQAVTRLLKDTPFQAVLTFGKKALVGISFYQYRDTSIGPYNEVGIAIPVVPRSAKKPFSSLLDLYSNLTTRRTGFYVLDLPVTTAAADAAGRELWGFPKFVTGIDYFQAGRHLHMRVQDPQTQGDILTFSGVQNPAIKLPPLSVITYSSLKGAALRTAVDVRGKVETSLGGNLTLHIGDSAHPMAQHLRDLGLQGAKPVLLQVSDEFQSRLPAGQLIP